MIAPRKLQFAGCKRNCSRSMTAIDAETTVKCIMDLFLRRIFSVMRSIFICPGKIL